jgi:serine/threonine protein kinase
MDTIAHFNILERLGTGALGDVFRARDLKVGRTVALMRLPQDLVATPERRQQFLADARKATALNHPNIATLFDVVEQDGRCYLAYEFAAGPSLREEMTARSLNLRRTLEIAAQTTDALAEGHARGLVHGDLRPENVVVTPKGSVKVLNFGLTPWTTSGQTRAAAVRPESMGTDPNGVAGYLSPEQAIGGAIDERSDIFSFGVLLYEMIAGKNPFLGPNPAATVINVIRLTPPPLVTTNKEAPADLAALVSRTLAKQVDARPQTALSVSSDLRRITSALEARDGEAPPAELIPVVPKRSGVVWVVVVVFVLVALAAWWYL